MRKLLTAIALVTGALCFGSVAGNATPITASSDILVNFSGTGGSPSLTGTAKAELGDFVFSGNKVTFEMNVTNTTASPIDARFTALGWVTTPATTIASDDSSVYTTMGPDKLSGTDLSVCLYGGSNCNGGSNGGLEDPANAGLHGDPTTTGIFNVTVTFTAIVPPLDFSSFIGKFQTANGSFDAPGTVAPGCPGCVINPVIIVPTPEPASIALLGFGVMGIAAVARRRRA